MKVTHLTHFASVLFAFSSTVFNLVNAGPTNLESRADGNIDTLVLQFALTLEHLESAFYSQYLAQFDQTAFGNAGYEPWVRNRLEQIAEHEASHVTLLSGALGSGATPACTYNFGNIQSPKDFLATAYIIEEVGTSAYLGASGLITEPAYLAVAASILTVEARHQGWESSSGLNREGWASGPYDTALAPGFVYDIVAPYFVSCPSDAYNLGFTAKPATTYDSSTGSINYSGMKDGDHVALVQGLSTGIYTIYGGKVTLPTVQGIAYVIPTSTTNSSDVTHDNSLAAPYILSVSFDSKVDNPPPSFTSQP